MCDGWHGAGKVEEDTSDHLCPKCKVLTKNNRKTDKLCPKCEKKLIEARTALFLISW